MKFKNPVNITTITVKTVLGIIYYLFLNRWTSSNTFAWMSHIIINNIEIMWFTSIYNAGNENYYRYHTQSMQRKTIFEFWSLTREWIIYILTAIYDVGLVTILYYATTFYIDDYQLTWKNCIDNVGNVQ